MNKNIIFISGPTAIGKSEVAVYLAKKINAEIVSCDSMQVYREVNIATNKPSEKEMQGVPHHLIDVVSVIDEFDVAKYNQLALSAIEDIHKRGKNVIVAGGTGMYMQVLLDGIFEGSPKDIELREGLLEQAEKHGSGIIYKMLVEEDPDAASKIHENDTKRIVRALEVCLTTNTKMSEAQKDRKGLWGSCDIQIFALNADREALYEKINERVDNMFDAGLVDEVKNISGLKMSITGDKIIGVKEVMGYLNGDYDLVAARDMLKQNTRRYAKRQLTWFRKEHRIKWIDIDINESREVIAGCLARLTQKK